MAISGLAGWFADNPDARDLANEGRKSGDSWGQCVAALQKHHDFPYNSETALKRFMSGQTGAAAAANNSRSPEQVVTDAMALRAQRRKEGDAVQKREMRKVQRALEKELVGANARADFFDSLAAAPDPEPYNVRAMKGQGKKLPAATYAMLASDWHMGERVRPENVGYRNEYNPEIAQDRARQFWKSNLIMLNMARRAWDIRQGVLWLGGDLMTGYIHEEYLEENFLSPVEEALLIFEVMVSGIKTLLAQSDLEHILIPTSNGNHGRTGLKIKIATYAKNSFEWMLYHMLDRHFEDEPRITFQIANGYNNLVDLYGYRINFHHGDAVGYGGGIGGIAIPMNRRIGRAAASIPVRWEGTEKGVPHLYVNGHFHSLQFPRFFMQNGSLIGWNDFAERIGCPFDDPQQASFVVDEKFKVVSNFNPILVDKPKK